MHSYSYDRTQPITKQFRILAKVLEGNMQDTNSAHGNFKQAMILNFKQTFGKDVVNLDGWRRLYTILSVSDNI